MTETEIAIVVLPNNNSAYTFTVLTFIEVVERAQMLWQSPNRDTL